MTIPQAETPGRHMAAEIAQSPGVFAAACTGDYTDAIEAIGALDCRAIYTVARGSSDAAANVLSYEFMRELGKPMTSLPPSIFSVGAGVAMVDTVSLIVSQSGASDDLVRTAQGARRAGGRVVSLVNQSGSAVEAASDLSIQMGAGPELAVPATKSVIGSIAAGMALLGALKPTYKGRAALSGAAMASLEGKSHPQAATLTSALLRADHVYVVGRDTGFGAAQEVALKLKECCAIHAEAYSSSEVLHGPLQLVTNPLLIIMLDTGQPDIQASLDTAEARFRDAGGTVIRLRPSDTGAVDFTPAAAAAYLLYLMYPIILNVALAFGLDPDSPETLSKVTQTT